MLITTDLSVSLPVQLGGCLTFNCTRMKSCCVFYWLFIILITPLRLIHVVIKDFDYFSCCTVSSVTRQYILFNRLFVKIWIYFHFCLHFLLGIFKSFSGKLCSVGIHWLALGPDCKPLYWVGKEINVFS